nr:Transposon Ty3-G Gag-Pol polyprotein [Ipomoea batatas]
MSTSNTTQNPHVASKDGNQNPSEQPWEASISALQQQLNQQAIFTHHSTQALQRSMHQLQQTIDSMRTSPPSMPTQQDMLDPPHIGHHTTLSDSNNRSTHLKFDPPKFSGTDPDGWIFRAQEYFEYNNVSSEQRLRVTSLLMEGEASDWFRWMKNNHLLTSWLDFTTQVKLRFDPSHFEDFVGQLSELTQLTTVGAYRSAYEKLLNKVTNVPAPVLISMFIAGLKPLIRREVMRAKLSSLTAAFALAHEVEVQQTEFQTEIRATALPAQRRHYPNSTQIAPFPVLNHPQPQQPIAQIQTPSNINRNTPLTLPVKHITPAMRQEKIEKGLCFSCDQKWSRNHKCPNRFLLLEAHEEDIEEAMESNQQLLTRDVSSLNSLLGSGTPRSLRLMGYIGKGQVHVLIDGGSTHNFIQPTVAENLALPLTVVKPFRVYIGNGDSLPCNMLCKSTPLKLQDHEFAVNFFVLPIQGPDVVLGVQWLQELGKITHDYSKLTMEFSWQGQNIFLQGDQPMLPTQISFHHLQALFSENEVLEGYELFLHTTNSSTHDDIQFPEDVPVQIQNVLQKFKTVFQTPSGPPPRRKTDHRIHLLPNTKPVNVRPYRYPHYQKTEIEKLFYVHSKLVTKESYLLERSKNALHLQEIHIRPGPWNENGP